LSDADVREMQIQHVVTEEVFAAVLPSPAFHRDNNIARDLYTLEVANFTHNTNYGTLKALEPNVWL